MFYESHGIQQEGWIIEVGEKAIGQQREHGKGQSRKAGKNQSWKHRSTCQNCGTVFAGRPGAANRFCKNDCQHEFSVKRWLACSRCLAAVGLGAKTSAKLLGVASGNINRQWKKFGIVAQRPQNGSWFATARKQQTVKQEEDKRLWRVYESAWMDEIKSARRGFDWSNEWVKVKANRFYHSLSPEEKSLKNRRRDNERKLICRREWGKKNRAYLNEQRKRWSRLNPEKEAINRQKNKQRIKENPILKAKSNMRKRFKDIMQTIKGGRGSGFSCLTGCTTDQLRIHLESQFKRGMTWANYGIRWHVDHIIPCAVFDHTDPKQRAQCWHWTNLRPLDAKKNMEKSDTITEPQMSLLLCATH